MTTQPTPATDENQLIAERREKLTQIRAQAQALGPLAFGHVTDLPRDNWRQAINDLKPDVIFASNTSTIPITSLAKNSIRPDRFIGINAARFLYAEIGHELERLGCDSVSQRAVVPAGRKAQLLTRILGTALVPAGCGA